MKRFKRLLHRKQPEEPQGVPCVRSEDAHIADETPHLARTDDEPKNADESLAPATSDRVLTPDNTRFYTRKLESRQMRLLEILPATYNEPVTCSFMYTYASNPFPQYVALSYCWGSQAEYQPIHLGRSEGYVITTHLYQGLRRLRHAREPRVVWIDAICINQADEDEKSHQVQQMSSIYSRAQRTVIWLGEMDAAQPTCRRDRDGVCSAPDLSAFEQQQATSAIQRKLREDEQHSRQPDHYMDVWWKRLWVVQEFASSKETPTVFVGPHAISWDFFVTLRWKDPQRTGTTEERPLFVRLRKDGPQGLYDLLRNTIDKFACGRPEDRIFALLSLVHDDALPLKADYTKSLEVVYAEALKYLAEKHKTVDIFLDQSRDVLPREVQAASWIPEWPWQFLWSGLYARGIEGYRACGYAPRLGLEQGRQSLQALVAEHRDVEASLSCACKSTTRLTARCLQFDRVKHIVDMKSLPELGTRWRKDCAIRLIPDDFYVRWRQTHSAGGHFTGYSYSYMGTAASLALEGELRRELWAPTYILGALQVDNRREKNLDLDRSPYIGYLMLEYLFEGSKNLVDMFGTRPFDADGYSSRVFCTAEAAGYEPTGAVIRDLEVAFHWQEAFLWKVHNGKRFSGGDQYMETCRERVRDTRKTRTPYPTPPKHPEIVARESYMVPMTARKISRVLFSTADGFTGLGPAGMKPGDEIVVPFGASRPWVLSSHGDHHVLIGDAVVPGIMSGRLETLYEDGLISAADYTLL
ncbi:hypothetical protein LTR85_006453 [Meristemomyces frigidus]|nr:hypothetical protein LTR85_006453 [Meristemomyces frigidus]